MLKNYLLIFLSIILSVIAQTLLKIGMSKGGVISSVSFDTILPLIWRMGTNIFVIAGLSLYVIGTFVWLILLSRLDLSFLFPFGALQYFIIYLISYFFLGEHITLGRIAGVALIMVGIVIISRFG